MLQIDNTIVSLDVIEKKFVCKLEVCSGACCVMGESGAPLTDQEADLLPLIYDEIKEYLRPEGIRAIEQHGFYYIDTDKDKVTTLIRGDDCAYTYKEGNIAKCAIEKAYMAGRIKFRKPVSCHLYPVRVTHYEAFDAVNYDKQKMCKAARIYGNELGVPVYKFLKDALIRKFDESWYEQLVYAAENLEINHYKKTE